VRRHGACRTSWTALPAALQQLLHRLCPALLLPR
jgi:hypothetical protein